jgi:hypothetical protein
MRATFAFASQRMRDRAYDAWRDAVEAAGFPTAGPEMIVALTNRRLLVFDSGRTPSPRGLLGSCSLADIGIGPITTGRWDTSQFVLTLPGAGTVPFVTGSREVDDLAALRWPTPIGRVEARSPP